MPTVRLGAMEIISLSVHTKVRHHSLTTSNRSEAFKFDLIQRIYNYLLYHLFSVMTTITEDIDYDKNVHIE